MTKRNALQEFKTAFDDFEEWAFATANSPRSLADYPHKDALCGLFVGFLEGFAPTANDSLELELLDRAVRADWQTQWLLHNLSELDLLDLLLRPYSNRVVRMYMLICGSRFKDVSLRQKVGLHFWENDDSDTVREYALGVLSQCNWPPLEQCAKELWDTGDSIKRTTALNCLFHAESPLLDQYLLEAEMHGDGGLQRIARSIRTLAAIKQNR